MYILDENIIESQRVLLEKWGIRTKQIGVDVDFKGVQDERIITTLQQLKAVIFITRDDDFFYHKYCHSSYCLVVLDVGINEVAHYVRKFIKHSEFNTQSKRLGKVVKINQTVIHWWQLKNRKQFKTIW